MSDAAHLFDLTEGQNLGADLIIRHPVSGEQMPDIVLVIAGPDSLIQRRALQQYHDEFWAFSGHAPASEVERIDIDRLARCVVGWRVKRDGEDVPYTFSNVVRYLTAFAFVRQQAEAFSRDRTPYFIRTPLAGDE